MDEKRMNTLRRVLPVSAALLLAAGVVSALIVFTAAKNADSSVPETTPEIDTPDTTDPSVQPETDTATADTELYTAPADAAEPDTTKAPETGGGFIVNVTEPETIPPATEPQTEARTDPQTEAQTTSPVDVPPDTTQPEENHPLFPLPDGDYETVGYGALLPSGSSSESLTVYCQTGTPVYAATDGFVTEAASSDALGNYIVVDYGSGNSVLYAHCSSMLVTGGAGVFRGQTIAAVGATGETDGKSQLGIFYYRDSQNTDPAVYFNLS